MSTPSPPSMEALTFNECLEIAEAIFSRTVNMQDLHFTDGIKHCTLRVLGSFNAPESKMMKIQRLAFSLRGYSPVLISILRTQPRLKHLELHQGGGNMRFEEADLPELESLKAHLWDAVDIVPGRPVRKLELLYDWNSEPSQVLFRQLTLSTCGITDFTTQFAHSGSDDVALKNLRLLCRHLPQIERLCLWLRCALSDSVLIETLPAFSSLSYLKLIGVVSRKEKFDEGQSHNSIAKYSPDDFENFVQSLKERCRNLNEVEWCRTATYSCSSWEGEIAFWYRDTQ
ncbi:hypothetical protein M407DRAFT_21997 [Tulasnella calospora MUT 4182]|uniref:F-box domain-containing protein n=1 Tax=Tulasnella calospora MUT 4182 TaxID=1051891 RepID=A0A0C3M5K4_9AGAM|nr:hypothetical protein M407DRAFT_21997 [Tulasnella calospora MUT 4182]